MLTTKKYLCFAMILALFCAVSYGGCGGSSSSDGLNGGSEDVYVPETENPENVTPTPVPVPDISPDVQPAPVPDTSPDVQPAPDTPNSSGGESVSSSLNGTWRVESGTYLLTINGLGSNTMPYIQGSASASTFNITVSKNSGNDYYSIIFSGNGVRENGTTDSSVICYFDTGDWAQYMQESRMQVDVLGGDSFEYSNNTYSTNKVYNYVNENYAASISFSMPDNSTITYKMYMNAETEGDGSGVVHNVEFTLKRVN